MTVPTHEPPLDQPYEGAPFGAAFVRFWKKGFTFTGRASRAEYWKAWLGTSGAVLALYILTIVLASTNSRFVAPHLIVLVAVLAALAMLIPSIAIAIRRLHDTNQPGGMYFLSFIPFVGGLILLFLLAQPSRPEGARFDLAPTGVLPPAAPPAPASSYGEISAPPAREPAPSAFSGGAPVPPVPLPPASSGFSTPPVPAAPVGFAPVPAPPASAAPPFSAGVPVAPIPGIPSTPVASAPPSAAPTPAPAPDLDSTRMVPPAVGGGWVVELPDGRRIAVDGAVSFGRDPVSDRGGVLVPVDDPARSMSKTHARFDIENGVVVVTDLHSTNGTRVEAPGAAAVSVAPGLPTTVPAGATVLFGDYAVRMQHRS